MVSYREPPWDPEARPIVIATPKEIRALRPAICASLRRYGVYERWVDDLAQDVEIVTWQALGEERVRGGATISPDNALLGFALMVARGLAANHRNRASNRREWLTGDLRHEVKEGQDPSLILDPVDPHDLEAQIEARDLISKIVPLTIAKVLLAAAFGDPLNERAKNAAVTRCTESSRLTRARRWFRAAVESDKWRQPSQPEPPRPRDRKRGR